MSKRSNFYLWILASIFLFLGGYVMLCPDDDSIRSMCISIFNPISYTEKSVVQARLTPEFLRGIRIISIIPFFGLITIIYLKDTISNILREVFLLFRKIVKEIFSSRQLLIGNVIALFFGILCIIFIPISGDESYAYIYFIERSPLVSIGTYPAANNHILFSFLSSCLDKIVPSINFSIRLIPFFFSILTFNIGYVWFKKYSDSKTAFLSILMIILGAVPLYYLVQGRGYSMHLFFGLMSFFLIKEKMKKEEDLKSFLLIIVWSLGIYTIPTFVYPFLIFSLLSLFFRSFKVVIKDFLLTTVLTFILYAPIVFTGGISTVSTNLERLEWGEIISKYIEYVSNLASHYFPVLILVFLSIFFSAKNKKIEKNIFIPLIGFLGVFLIPLFDLRFAPVRTFIWISIFGGILFFEMVNLNWIKPNLGFFIIPIIVLHAVFYIPKMDWFNKDLRLLHKKIEQQNPETIFTIGGPNTSLQLQNKKRKVKRRINFLPFGGNVLRADSLEKGTLIVVGNKILLSENSNRILVDSTVYFKLFEKVK